MSEVELGGSRWDNLRHVASWARMSCQKRYDLDDIDTDNYNEFLIEKQKNPTAAEIALRESIRKQPREIDNLLIANNRRLLEREPENDYLARMLDKDYKKKYPKTGTLREVLIENDRFCLNRVTPKIISKLEKLALKLKAFVK